MKATLEFNLENQTERIAHMRCVKANDMANVLFDIIGTARVKVEERLSADPDLDDKNVFDGVDEVFMEVFTLMLEYGIDINELVD